MVCSVMFIDVVRCSFVVLGCLMCMCCCVLFVVCSAVGCCCLLLYVNVVCVVVRCLWRVVGCYLS